MANEKRRLIDANELRQTIESKIYWGGVGLLEAIDDAPTVDAVEVVRCKDCAVPHNKWTGCPKLSGLVPTPDFYCAYGERNRND